MNIAAFDLEESNKYENHFFLCTSNHKVTAMEMVKPLTEDLLDLEKGIVMYDAELQKNVFVIAPVLFFRGDNVRQAELALSKGLGLITHPIALRYSSETYTAELRTLEDFLSFVNPEQPERASPGEIGFKLTDAEDLLKLKAVDLSQDLPLQLLTQFFRNYNSKVLHRNLTSSLTAFRSFVGRDFKILVQLLPTLLQKANFFNSSLFDENQDSFRSMFECFDNLGLLASLVYMEKINNFHYYKQILDITVSKTITAMDDLHHTTVLTRRRSAAAGTEAITKRNFSSLCNRLKSHLLIHISQDVERFSGGPHTETERDVAVRFAEEFMLRHISQGGLFVKDPSSSLWETCGVKVLESFDATINQSELELLDNNNSQKKLALGTTGVFRNGNSSKSSGLSLGKTVMKNGQDFLVQAYDFVCHDSFSQGPQSSIYESCVLDVAGNVITRRLPGDDFVIAGREQNRVEFVLDMSQPPISSDYDTSSTLSINKSKFDSIWWLLNTRCSLEKIVRLPNF
ncbi:uncharacterized protein EV154DRAFT_584455 [Mucor mucedo]|uniref:uncharacterized protein n=1 Tax=Mucor mucedo TaxID=29922 RepID=UPI0022212569|nr:uncharacterized protein EV154DRAFT_584455 [Mucor mucedo]KAI7865214.1 hypothetical protein EV154DRAFT_584455 [Mucor mucedo]